MSTINDQLFITEIDATRRLNETRNLDLLQPVRKEHSKLKEVVESFRLKVDKLIDKQRQEYVQAYENHVQDVQKELHNLREKVYEIANDDTKNERTEKLTDDLQSYKNEAIKLEEDSDELRSVMARLVRKIYAAEKSRDWMLKKLRVEKKRYNLLLREKMRLFEENSLSSMDNTSNYTLEFNDFNPDKTAATINTKFQRGIRSHASVNRSIHLPKINTSEKNFNISSDPLIQRALSSPNDLLEDEKSRLLALRGCMQELRDFLKTCENSTDRRPWNRVEKRDLASLIRAGEEICQQSTLPPNKELLPIICEFASTPEVYESVLDLIGPAHDL